VTWIDGSRGIVGEVSAANSLVGTSEGDTVGDVLTLSGSRGFAETSSGHYVVVSPHWNNGSLAQVGAATVCDSATGRIGPISASNSLIGAATGDFDHAGVTALDDGNFVVYTPHWDNGASADVGAVTWIDAVAP